MIGFVIFILLSLNQINFTGFIISEFFSDFSFLNLGIFILSLLFLIIGICMKQKKHDKNILKRKIVLKKLHEMAASSPQL